LIQSVVPQLTFSFYRQQLIQADFSGGQITSDAGLLPLRAFDQRHHLTRDWAAGLSDPRQDDRVRHDSLRLLRQRIYQIVAGYEDANDAGRLRHDPLLQIVADQKLGDALGSQPTLSRWENSPSGRDLNPLHPLPSGHRLAVSEPVLLRRPRPQQQLDRILTSELHFPQAAHAEPCAKTPSITSRRRTVPQTSWLGRPCRPSTP